MVRVVSPLPVGEQRTRVSVLSGVTLFNPVGAKVRVSLVRVLLSFRLFGRLPRRNAVLFAFSTAQCAQLPPQVVALALVVLHSRMFWLRFIASLRANCMVLISSLVWLVRRLCTIMSCIAGAAILARIPRMTTVIMSSIRVKPLAWHGGSWLRYEECGCMAVSVVG